MYLAETQFLVLLYVFLVLYEVSVDFSTALNLSPSMLERAEREGKLPPHWGQGSVDTEAAERATLREKLAAARAAGADFSAAAASLVCEYEAQEKREKGKDSYRTWRGAAVAVETLYPARPPSSSGTAGEHPSASAAAGSSPSSASSSSSSQLQYKLRMRPDMFSALDGVLPFTVGVPSPSSPGGAAAAGPRK